MASGRIDLLHSPIPENTIYLTFNGLGSNENGLRGIGSGKQVVLRRGSVRRQATVRFRENGESFTNDLEMNAKLASSLRLRANYRYLVDYDAKTNILSFVPSPISSATAKLQIDSKIGANRLQIGYELLSTLGIPESRSLSIVCQSPAASKSLQVSTPSNLFDRSFSLDSASLRALRLTPGSNVAISYNQNTKVLTLKPSTPRAAPKSP
ncbi:hypothetical protein [Cohnella sp. AR92]|uniref:hypothetical protein n=1 Tax=Cohnella sp. AR92 TaxID=648716 RepID=UPI000F8EC896|nr:hypothetical protein [Cohnella sp. AR92]RUS48248.1 hypothetical protein ELR57_06910 [Cohnella sp. AR92]